MNFSKSVFLNDKCYGQQKALWFWTIWFLGGSRDVTVYKVNGVFMAL